MKQSQIKIALNGIDNVFDPKNNLSLILQKTNPKLALDITPTTNHALSNDLFRVYTFKLLKELSKKFQIILIYRDLQATLNMSIEDSKKLIEDNISLMRASNVTFTVFYESEILQNYISKMPEKFFKHLYQNILHKKHNFNEKDLMFSSTSLSILIPLLEILKIDALLCMEEEKENVIIVNKILTGYQYFPTIFYRSLRDLKNKKHSASDGARLFPMIGWNEKTLHNNFINFKTNTETFRDWYNKLGIDKEVSFEYGKEKISFNELLDLYNNKQISINKLLRDISKNICEFLLKESKFLEVSSKELKLNLNNENTGKLLNSLNTNSRIKIIKLLNKANLSAYEISTQINISLPTTLFHLNKLQKVGIIERKDKIYNLKINRFTLYT